LLVDSSESKAAVVQFVCRSFVQLFSEVPASSWAQSILALVKAIPLDVSPLSLSLSYQKSDPSLTENSHHTPLPLLPLVW